VQETLDAIAQPRRREILRLVGGSEMSAGEIASHFRVTRPAISQHLTVLKRAGLVTERREGTKRIYALRPEGLDEVRAFIDGMWRERLSALKREAEREERRRRAARGHRRR
jgi:DNA-binding transcriptional ArsR family regulator